MMMDINKRHLKAAGLTHIPWKTLIGTTEQMISDAFDGKAPFEDAKNDEERQAETLRYWNMKKKEDDEFAAKLNREAYDDNDDDE